MNNIFYNIVSIIIGVILIGFGIVQIIKKVKAIGIISIIHGLLFIGFGIFGFFLPKEYEFISILAMLALVVTMILSLLLVKTTKKD